MAMKWESAECEFGEVREQGRDYGDRHFEAVQCDHGVWIIQPDDGSTDVFVHISAVERAGLRGLNDGQKITYELVKDRKSGKMSADNLQG
jgi:CspA family cold shock protein